MATYDQLINAIGQAERAGDMRAVAEIQRMIQAKEYDEESGTVASALQGIGQGATFGLADEAGAGVRAALFDPIVSSIAGGDIGGVEGFKDYFTGMGERYKTALGSQREAVETARREDPWTTGIGEVVGGLGTGGVGAAKAVAGQTFGRGMRNLAATGAAQGALAGYGYGEGDAIQAVASGDLDQMKQEFSEAARNVGVGAGVGGTIGGALPVVGAAARGMARLVASPFTRNAKLANEGRERVTQALLDDAQYMGFTTKDEAIAWAERELAKTPGMTIADMGPALRELTEEVAQTATQGGRVVRESLIDRNKQQWQRMYPKLQEAFDVEDQFAAGRRQLLNNMRTEADRLYTRAHATPTRITDPMRRILRNPEFADAFNTSNRLRAMADPPLPAIGVDDIDDVASLSGREIDWLLQGMDETVSSAYSGQARNKAVANVLRGQRDEFRDAVYSSNPRLRRARDQWAGDSAANEALDKGLRILRDDADVTADIIRGMSNSERVMFNMGALRAFTRKLGAKPDTGDLTTVFKSENAKEALRVALGGEKKLREFLRFIEGEQKLFGTFHQAVGNSATARRLRQTPEVGGKLAALFGYTGALASGTGAPPAIVGYGARRGYEAIAPQGRRLARERLQRGAQAESLLGGTDQLQRLMAPQTMGGLLGTGVPTTAAGATGGLLATGLPQPGEEYGR